MSGRETFNAGLQKTTVQSQPSAIQNMRLAFSADGTAVYKPVATTTSPTFGNNDGPGSVTTTAVPGISAVESPASAPANVQHNVSVNSGETLKRKRGRPRKYGPDGAMSLALTPVISNAVPTSGQVPSGLLSPSSDSSLKKARGRPLGSGKKQQMDALGSAGIGFTPHVITVKAGEDVSSKIMSFSQHGPRAVCILSANGAISNVTLRQAATSGGTVTYEGRFEILSLSGSFLLSESSGQRSRTGGLSVSLAGPDGRVLGGGVAGLLIAASPVQVVVGSFIADGGRKGPKATKSLDPSGPLPQKSSGPTATGSPPSRGTTLSESSGGQGSPLNHSTGACNNSNQHIGMASMSWK